MTDDKLTDDKISEINKNQNIWNSRLVSTLESTKMNGSEREIIVLNNKINTINGEKLLVWRNSKHLNQT